MIVLVPLRSPPDVPPCRRPTQELTLPRSILMISKPIAPPWNDSSKNLVKDLASAGRRYSYRVLAPRGYQLPAPGVVSEPVYSDSGAYTPALVQNARVMGRLLRRDDSVVTHFFFAPNLRSSMVARIALALRPRRTVQTVCSTPASFRHSASMLFADRVVVLSRHSQQRFLDAGVDPRRLVVILPGIQIPSVPDPAARRDARRRHGLPLDRPVVIYPGDYQFSSAAWTVARAILQLERPAATFVLACRIKQPASLEVERRVRDLLGRGGALPRVRMLREVDDMPGLLTACDLCLLPAESLYAKMDLPLVLLEAMARGVGVVVADRPPLNELARDGGALTVPAEDPWALASVVRQLLDHPDRLRELGQRAREVAAMHHDIKSVSQLHEDLYQEMTGG